MNALPQETPAATPPAPRRSRWPRALLGLLLGVVTLTALLLGGVAWLWHNPAALQRALQQVPGLQMQGVQGRPNGGPYAVERLQWQGAGGLRVLVEGLAWDDMQWTWRPYAGAWAGVALQRLRATRVQVTTAPAPPAQSQPRQPPQSLELPVEVSAPGLRIGRVEVDAQPAITDIAADLHVGASAGAEHRIEQLQLRRDGLSLGGRAVVGSRGAMALDAQLTASTQPGAAQAWQASARLQGPLQRLMADARIALTDEKTKSTTGAATVQATLAPFAAWPLLALRAQAQDLDLSVLAAGLPRTRLSGRAVLAEPAQAQTLADPLAIELMLDNAEPGAWDAGRLPVAGLQLRLQGRPAQPGRYDFDRLELRLAGGGAAPGQCKAAVEGGVVTGSGQWQDRKLALTLQLRDVHPERLDGRAPMLTVEGQVALSVDGLAAPGSAAAGQPGLAAQLDVDLVGRLPRRTAPPLALQAQATMTQAADGALTLSLTKALARGGAAAATSAVASATGQAQKSAAGQWRVQSAGELRRFDPGVWWPAAAARAGAAQHIDARWSADLGWDGNGTTALTDTITGQARFTLDDSRLLGLPLRGQAALDAGAGQLKADADLQAGANRLKGSGSLARGAVAKAPFQGQLDIDAPELSALSPLAALLPASAAAWWPRAGALNANAKADGTWPVLQSTGSLRVQGLRSHQLAVARADAQWDVSTRSADAPLSLHLESQDLTWDGKRVERIDARLAGSVRAHTLQLRASSPVRPPQWLDVAGAAATSAADGSQLVLDARGSWIPSSAAASTSAGSWRGTLERLHAASRRAPNAPWLAAADLQARVDLDAAHAPIRAELSPGRVTAFGSALSWQQAQWQAAGTAAPQLNLQARLEPMPIAPWLQRLQPQFGWQGDLMVGGTINVRGGERLDADVNFQRTGGDLSLTIEGVTRALGLSDVHVGLAAHDGLWEFTQALVGRNVGIVGGLQSLRTSAQALWPAPDAPLTGGLSLQVPELGLWAPWLPPGWRLGGQLRVAASFAGTAGAPQYRGDITGEELAVRNIFEGIDLRRGALAMALAGNQATVDRLEFRDGREGDEAGSLRVTGRVDFGSEPRATLRAVTQKLRVLDRFDRRVSLSGSADLDLQAQRQSITGSFTIDDGVFDATQADAPASDADVLVINRAPLKAATGRVAAVPVPPQPRVPIAAPPGSAASTGPASVAAPVPSPFGQANVDLRVDLGRSLRLRGRGLDTLLRGSLRVTTPGGHLSVVGTVDAEEGTYTAYGQNLRIERGGLRFDGEVATPQLDFLALRADIDTRVGVIVTGSVINPRVRLYSEPELGQLDTLTWLLLGRAPEGLGRDDAALLQRAALALLAGEQGGNGIVQRLGLDELSLRRGGSTDGTAGETVLSLGKQLSKRLYVGYEQALGAATGTVALIYRIADRLTLRARTGFDNSIDAIWTWRWD